MVAERVRRASVSLLPDGRACWPLLSLIVVLMMKPVNAANWEVQPSLRVAQTWTDNVALAAEDTEEEWITEITPRLRVSGEGRRTRLDFLYRLRNFFHARDSDRDRTTQLMAGDGEIELVRQRLFFDGDVSRTEQIRSPDGEGPTGAFVGGVTQNVTTVGGGPRLQYEFGNAANLRARHRRERVERGADDRTTDTDLTTTRLASGPTFTTWGWALDYSRREERRDLPQADLDDEDVVLERGSAELNLRVLPSTQLFGVSGYERNRFRTEVEGERIDGSFWEAGVRWSPGRNTFMEAAVGERFFGETARFLFNTRGAAFRFNLSLTEDLVTTSQIQAQRSEQIVRDEDGNLILDPEGEPVTVVVTLPTVVDDVIRQRRAQARLGWSRSYSDLRLVLSGTEREFLLDGTREDARQANLGYTWSRLRRSTITSSIGYSHTEFAGTDREDETYSFRLGATRDFGTNLDGRVDYQHFVRDSNVDGQEYTSNRITVALEATF